MQMICALLIFQTPDLPAPLAELSPWMEWLPLNREKLLAGLAAQKHRRFIKTHTPLKGLPLDPRVAYVGCGPASAGYGGVTVCRCANLDVRRLNELAGYPETGTPEPLPPLRGVAALLGHLRLRPVPAGSILSPGVMHHVADALVTQQAEPNVILVHYDDLAGDLEGQMRQLAARLGIAVPASLSAELVSAATTFRSMRSRAEGLTPGPPGLFLDDTAFFRSGRVGHRQRDTDSRGTRLVPGPRGRNGVSGRGLLATSRRLNLMHPATAAGPAPRSPATRATITPAEPQSATETTAVMAPA